MHYLAFAENVISSAAHDDNDNTTTTTTTAFGDDNEFPPLRPTDDGWQLVDKNEDEPYSVVQHQQEEDWQCIVDASSTNHDFQNKLPLYAQIAQEAAMLPSPASSSSKKRSPPARRPLVPKTSTISKDNIKSKGMAASVDEEVGDELFAQYKSSSWLRRRYRPRHLHRHAHNQKPSFLRSYHHNYNHHHHDHQDPTAANAIATRQKKNKHTIKRRSRAKKQPTRTWMERENGWVPVHAKIRNK